VALHVRHPDWIHALGQAGAKSFALIFALESLNRALLSTILPLQVLKVTGSATDLSYLYLVVGLSGLVANLCIVSLIRFISRRGAYTIGLICLAAAPLLIGTSMFTGVSFGMFIRIFGTACGAICLNLYVLDHIKGRALNEMEPIRLLFSAAAWTLGPWLGVYLWSIMEWLPFILSSIAALIQLAYFWYLRLREGSVIVPARQKPETPFGSIIPFIRRKPLRRAWLIALGRSVWWVSFFTYLPVFGVESGLSPETCALLVSAANGLLFLVPVLKRVGNYLGIRRALILAYAFTGIINIAAGVAAWFSPFSAMALLLFCALFVVLLDIYGNLTFLRMVKPLERTRMTPIFITYRDVSDIVAPAAAGLVLIALPLPAYFVLLGLYTLGMTQIVRNLPRRF
jgi:MFS family permease